MVPGATEEQQKNIADAFTDFFTVKVGGRYEMIPDNESEMLEKEPCVFIRMILLLLLS